MFVTNSHSHIIIPDSEIISIYNLSCVDNFKLPIKETKNQYYSAGIHPWYIDNLFHIKLDLTQITR
ncbi:MAG: hypothetical protein A2X12_10935 [Bacteroidetes bacterium GWE2_29_8]|nr:MAG: hypothetical protein A2X12_10935 [Bacteroidetes bacterium GWE2_29_8]